MYVNKRKLIELEEFDLHYLQKIMRSLFPKKNDCASESGLVEVLDELNQFGIVTKKQVRLFLKKYRRWLLEIEKEPMDKIHQKIYREDLGDEEFLNCMRRQYWFCYPALIRNAMEVEFGQKYDEYARKSSVHD
jgi:hypothetical protein